MQCLELNIEFGHIIRCLNLYDLEVEIHTFDYPNVLRTGGGGGGGGGGDLKILQITDSLCLLAESEFTMIMKHDWFLHFIMYL